MYYSSVPKILRTKIAKLQLSLSNDVGRFRPDFSGGIFAIRARVIPFFFQVGQLNTLDAVQEEYQDREVLLASHDDIYVVTPGSCTCVSHAVLQEYLHAAVRNRINWARRKSRTMVRSLRCAWTDCLICWPWCPNLAGIFEHDIWGTPWDTFCPSTVFAEGSQTQTLLDGILQFSDVQSAWSLLLHCVCVCVFAKVHCFFRVVKPNAVAKLPSLPKQAPRCKIPLHLFAAVPFPSVWPPPWCVRKVWTVGQKGGSQGGRRRCWDELFHVRYGLSCLDHQQKPFGSG